MLAFTYKGYKVKQTFDNTMSIVRGKNTIFTARLMEEKMQTELIEIADYYFKVAGLVEYSKERLDEEDFRREWDKARYKLNPSIKNEQ